MNKVVDVLKKDPFNSFVSIMAVATSFVFLALIIIFVAFSNTAVTFLQKQVELTLFIKDGFEESSILELKSVLETDSRVMEVEYISKEKALEIFNSLSKDDASLQEAVTVNIFPASLKIRTFNLSDLDSLASEYQVQDYVESIRYSREIKDSFSYYSQIISLILVILFLMILTISFGIIISTIRLNIFQKKEEIEIMKLVGATDKFISRPFIFQGLVFTLVGSFIASVISLVITLGVYFTNTFGMKDLNRIFFTTGFSLDYLAFVLFLVIFINLFGYLFGYFWTKVAVSKYLKI